MGLWKFYQDIEKWNDTTEFRRQEIIDALLTNKFFNAYNYPSTLSDVIGKVDDEETILKLFNNYVHNAGTYALSNDCAYLIVHQVHEKITDKEYVRDTVQKSKCKKMHRAFLLLDDKTEKEEELGLRALSTIKYAPDILYTKRYKPSHEALKNLPPVMRLKTLESLLSNSNIAYNIFDNFANEDEFRSLLFGAVLRHRDRVEAICDKYHEMKDLGSEATVLIKCTCENCGEYEVSVKSTRVRTQTGFGTTQIGDWMSRNSCSLCGKWGENEKQVICEGVSHG